MISQARRQGLVWGGLLILFGALLLIETFTNLNAWVWVAILVVAGFAAFALFLSDRSDWGLLIPSYALWAIAALVALVTLEILRDTFIATFVLAAIALPFLVTFLRNRKEWWPLIPTYILCAVGVMVALIGMGVLSDLLVPAYVMFAIAIPFFVVYARNTKEWWPLIPGGIMAIIGVSFLIAESAVQYIGPVALVIIGGWILVRQFMPQKTAESQKKELQQLAEQEPSGAESDGPPTE